MKYPNSSVIELQKLYMNNLGLFWKIVIKAYEHSGVIKVKLSAKFINFREWNDNVSFKFTKNCRLIKFLEW